MIWHNTKYNLPGYTVGSVLARCIIDGAMTKPHYIIAQFIEGFWYDATDDMLAEKDEITISHWARIEDAL